jgi:superfamily II DNA/RNA helicase
LQGFNEIIKVESFINKWQYIVEGDQPADQGLKTADMVVGTPGRILDHINRKTIKFDNKIKGI